MRAVFNSVKVTYDGEAVDSHVRGDVRPLGAVHVTVSNHNGPESSQTLMCGNRSTTAAL